jgi:hypothetical protein
MRGRLVAPSSAERQLKTFAAGSRKAAEEDCPLEGDGGDLRI